jgi:endonuclease/exonuclease/phosphatase family metal-dependent hydrolase
MQVLVSSNYAAASNPNTATWTALPATLPLTSSNVWTLSQNINLTPYKATPFRIAYKYTSTTSAAASWKVDDVNITDGTISALSKKMINVGQCNAGSQTTAQSFTFTMSAINGTFNVTVPAPFQLSKDNVSFSNSLNYTAANGGIPQTVYVRIAPTVADKLYRKEIEFVYNGATLGDKVYVLGTSMPDVTTLRVASWNMRWFGNPSMCACDTTLAKANALKILKDMNADVYCLEEVVSTSQLASITSALGSNFNYTVSPFCSGAQTTSSFNYASGQKLAYIYNTAKVQNIGTFGLLKSTYPSDTSAYYCFSSGRFPYVMKAVLSLNGGLKDTIIFTNIHAKAGDLSEDHNRRVCGAQKMTDSLKVLFPGKKVMVIGDFNDYLEGANAAGQTVSPYQYLLNNGFNGISLPSLYPTQSTFVGSTSHIIDNVVCTPNLKAKYIDSSFFIFTEANKYITDYSTTTSDHYPIMSYYQFNFPFISNGINTFEKSLFGMVNPSNNILNLYNIENGTTKSSLTVYDMMGKIVYQALLENFQSHLQISIPNVKMGLYLVEINNDKGRSIQKWNVVD